MTIFVTATELELVAGGYVSIKGEKINPVSNEEFETAQKQAEYIITLAEKAKGKDLVGKKADTKESIIAEVDKALADKATVFVSKPKEVKQELTEKLKAEALAFIDFKGNSGKTEKINAFLQQFNILKEFEEFGLFFEPKVTKLNKIYTLDEVIVAVTEVIDILD